MSWNNHYPAPEDFDTIEEWEYACELYDSAEDDYIEEFLERRHN